MPSDDFILKNVEFHILFIIDFKDYFEFSLLYSMDFCVSHIQFCFDFDGCMSDAPHSPN